MTDTRITRRAALLALAGSAVAVACPASATLSTSPPSVRGALAGANKPLVTFTVSWWQKTLESPGVWSSWKQHVRVVSVVDDEHVLLRAMAAANFPRSEVVLDGFMARRVPAVKLSQSFDRSAVRDFAQQLMKYQHDGGRVVLSR